jgi:hypothetical protein
LAVKVAVAFALPTPATSYELQLTVVPLVVQSAEVFPPKCAPVGPFAGLMVARAAEADAATTNIDSAVMIPTLFMFSSMVVAPATDPQNGLGKVSQTVCLDYLLIHFLLNSS